MFLYFLYPLHTHYSFLNIFKYITVRSFGSAITAVFLSLVLGPVFIRFLQRKQMKQAIRDDGPQSHLSKKGTPTMGGGLILFSIAVAVFLWGDWTNHHLWIALATTLLYGVVGFTDDYKKVI